MNEARAIRLQCTHFALVAAADIAVLAKVDDERGGFS